MPYNRENTYVRLETDGVRGKQNVQTFMPYVVLFILSFPLPEFFAHVFTASRAPAFLERSVVPRVMPVHLY